MPAAAAQPAPEPTATGGQEVALVLAARAGVLVFAQLSQSLLAYTLLPEGRGDYAIYVTFAVLAGMLFAVSADRGAQYAVMAKRLGLPQGASAALTVSLVGSALAAGLALPFIHGGFGSDFFRETDTRSAHLALLLTPLTAVSSVLSMQLAGLRRFARLTLFLLLQSAATAAAIAVLSWGMGLGVNGAVAAMAAGHATMIAVCLRDLRRHCGLAFETPSRAGFRLVLDYGLRFHGGRIGGEIEPRIGVFALWMLAGKAEIGLFAVASALMLRFTEIANAVGVVLYPRVAGAGGKQHELYALCFRLVFWVTAAALAALLAGSAPLVRLLFSEAFLPMVPLLWIMAPGILAGAAGNVSSTYFSGSNRPEVYSRASYIGLTANAASLFWLYPRMGVNGAAWAMTAGMFARCVFLGAMFHRATGMTPAEVWLPRRGDFAYLRDSGRQALSRAFAKRRAAR